MRRDVSDVNNLWVVTTIRPPYIVVLAIYIEVNILIGPPLIVGYTKLYYRAIGTILAKWEYHNAEPLTRGTRAQEITTKLIIMRVVAWLSSLN